MFLFQTILLLFFIIIGSFLNLSDGTYINGFCLIIILIFGIPHGALDHKIHLSTSRKTTFIQFITSYLFIGFCYGIWWFLYPLSAFWFFLLLSAYHFGQETFESHKLKSNPIGSAIVGSFILLFSLLFHYQETVDFVSTISPNILPNLETKTAIIIALEIALICFIYLFYSFFTSKNKDKYIRLILFCTLYILININYGLLSAFSIYFIFNHSLNAFTHQYEWLKREYASYDFREFLKDLTFFSLMAIIGIVLILWLVDLKNSTRLITYFFILVSIITLPHAITFNRFYQVRKV